MWMARRASISDPWGTPVNLGPTVNSPHLDCSATLSPDGQTLYFTSDRPGGLGGPYGDIYQAPILPIVDFNGDGEVAMEDFLVLIDNWGQDEPLCDIGPMPWGDGIVDDQELEVLMSYWEHEVQDGTLLAHWKLDETEGMVAFDSAGGHDGTVVGLVWDGAARSLHVDDVLVAEDTQSRMSGCYGGLNIGCDQDMVGGMFFTGLIDEVRVYNRAVRR